MGTSKCSPLPFIRIADNTVPGRNRRVVLVEKMGQKVLVTKGFWGRVALRIQDLFTTREKVVARNKSLVDYFRAHLNEEFIEGMGKVGTSFLSMKSYDREPLYEAHIRAGVDLYRKAVKEQKILKERQVIKGNIDDTQGDHLTAKYVSPVFKSRETDSSDVLKLFDRKRATRLTNKNPFIGKNLSETELESVLTCVFNEGNIIDYHIVKDVVNHDRVESKYAPLIRQAISGLEKFDRFAGTVYLDTGKINSQKEFEILSNQKISMPNFFEVASDTHLDEKEMINSKNVFLRIQSKNGRIVNYLGANKIVFPPGTSYEISVVTRNKNNKGAIIDLTEQ